MKGFKIRIGSREITAALPGGSCGPIITYAQGKATIVINGVTQDLWTYRWFESELKPGDFVTILCTELEKASEPVEISDQFRLSAEEQVRIQTENELKTYHELRRELLKEGLLTPDM